MKIRYNKVSKYWEVYSKTMFGEINTHANFLTKQEAKDYVFSGYGV